MIGRLFWFAVGVGVTALLVVKGREYYRKFTPEGVTQQVDKTTAEARTWLNDFVETYSAASREREDELREALGLDGAGLPGQGGLPVQETART